MPLPPQDDQPPLSEFVPFSYWFLTGGTTGAYRCRPPSWAEFMRLASERKTVHRWAHTQAEAADAAAARKKTAIAQLAEEHGPLGSFGGTKSTSKAPAARQPRREELMARFGPGSDVRASRGLGGILAWRADNIAEKLRRAQAPGRAESPIGTAEAPGTQAANGSEPEEPAARTPNEPDD